MLRNKAIYSLVSMTLAIIMIVLPVATPISAVDFVSASKQTKIDPLLREKMAEASADEKIPVAIWYTDVDQTQIDSLTKDRVGFDAESVALDYEMPSLVTMNSAKEGDAQATAELQDYFQRTERQREIEKQRTDEYVMTRREISRDKYNEKSARVIKEAEIPQKSIGFSSQYAPMIIAELTVAEITEISANSNVEAVYYEEEVEEETAVRTIIDDDDIPQLSESDINRLIYNTSIIKNVLGYTELLTVIRQSDPTFVPGDGITIGVAETKGKVHTSDDELINSNIVFAGDVEYKENQPAHMTGTVRVIASSSFGFANGADIVCSNITYSSIETMLNMGVQLINVSSSLEGYYNYYCNQAMWYEHLVSQHGVTIVGAAGNTNNDGGLGRLVAPAMCYNAIGVGAYWLSEVQATATENMSDDRMADYSAYVSVIDNEKPDVIMPHIPYYGGTSYAAPILTSFIAIMYQLKPSLALCPQAVKAIVLASCHRKVNPSTEDEAPELMTQGITERQGAGAPDIWVMASIVTQGTYGIGSLKANASEDVVRFVQPAYGATSMNVSLTWLKNNYITPGASHQNDTSLVNGTHINLDLSVHHGNTQTAVNCTNSTTEMAYFNLVSGEKNYEIHIQRQSGAPSGSVKYGYAYSLNNAEVTPITDEGIYYLKNHKTNTYLTLNNTTGDAFMQNFTGTDNQIWILKKKQNTKYELYPGYGNVTGMMSTGDAYNTSSYYAEIGTENMDLYLRKDNSIEALEDGTVTLYTYIGSNISFLYATGTEVLIRNDNINYLTTNSMWHLEKLNYKVGDVTLDGNINVRDVTEIQKWLGNLAELSNVQLYLADVNGDGNVTIHDVTALQNIL